MSVKGNVRLFYLIFWNLREGVYDIDIEENLHEISEKISSSVRYPRASAKSMILFLNSSNCSSRR